MKKAPAGGTVSVVNGQRYEGGEFMPEHGLYCGKGRNRVKAEVLAKINSETATGRRIEWSEKHGVFHVIGPKVFLDGSVFEVVLFVGPNPKTLAKYWL